MKILADSDCGVFPGEIQQACYNKMTTELKSTSYKNLYKFSSILHYCTELGISDELLIDKCTQSVLNSPFDIRSCLNILYNNVILLQSESMSESTIKLIDLIFKKTQ